MIVMTKSTNYLPNHQHTNNINDGGSLVSNVTLVNNQLMENYVPTHDHSTSSLGGNLDNSTQMNNSSLVGFITMVGLL